jgi:membrane protein required for colicin V production
MTTWNWLDCILAAIVVASVAAAIMKGFVRELISLASVLVGLLVAAFAYPRAALWFDDLTKSHEVALGLGFLTLFLATLIVGALVGVVVRKIIKTAGIQWFDRFLGGIFGLVRGILVDAIVLMALMAFAIKPEAISRSALAPYVTTAARAIAVIMPGSLRAQFHLGFEKFREALIQRDTGVGKR